MITRSYLIDKIADEVRLPTIKDKIGVEVAQAYYEICKKVSWLQLRDKVDVDFATLGTAAGLWLPANIIGIDAVVDKSSIAADDGTSFSSNMDVVEFLPRDESGIADNSDNNYRWFYAGANQTPLYEEEGGSGHGVMLTKGSVSVTFSGSAVASTVAGEYLSLKGVPGFFKLATNSTLARPYCGSTTATPLGYQIRPAGQKMLMCIDELRGNYSKAVRVYYYGFPQPLIGDSTPILVPERLVELLSFIRVVGTYGRREQTANKYREEYEALLTDEVNRNPKFGRRAYPRDKHRKALTMSAPLFRTGGRDLRGFSR